MQRRLILALLYITILVPCHSQTRPSQEERFFEWTTMQFSTEEYASRRDSMFSKLRQAGGGVFLVPSLFPTAGPTFRQLDNFLYFTGLELPNSILVFDTEKNEAVVFAPRRDNRFERPPRTNDFPGRPLADDSTIAEVSGIETIQPFDQFELYLSQLANENRVVWIDLGSESQSIDRLSNQTIAAQPNQSHALARYVLSHHQNVELRNGFALVATIRVVKSPAEISVMRSVAEISARALLDAAATIREGNDERSLEAVFEAGCKYRGAQRLAFPSIIKSGPNSLWPWRILATHYDRRNRTMENGDLVIFDVGCELDHYVSDMGRTFPISGSFTEEQRELLRWVTGVADSIIAAVRPGITLRELTEIAQGQIPADQRQYMQTGLYYGHHLGLSTGDPFLADQPLEPGMIFTVEPWYYNHETQLAVFIEDEVLVTETGAEVLTTLLPRTPEDLESIVGTRLDNR